MVHSVTNHWIPSTKSHIITMNDKTRYTKVIYEKRHHNKPQTNHKYTTNAHNEYKKLHNHHTLIAEQYTKMTQASTNMK